MVCDQAGDTGVKQLAAFYLRVLFVLNKMAVLRPEILPLLLRPIVSVFVRFPSYIIGIICLIMVCFHIVHCINLMLHIFCAPVLYTQILIPTCCTICIFIVCVSVCFGHEFFPSSGRYNLTYSIMWHLIYYMSVADGIHHCQSVVKIQH